MLSRLLLSLVCVTATALAQQTIQQPSFFKYTAPAGYTRDDSGRARGDFAFWAKSKDGFAASIGIACTSSGGRTSKDIGLDGVYAWKDDPSVKILSHGAAKLGGREAYYIETVRTQGKAKVWVYTILGVNKDKMVGFHVLDLQSRRAATHKKFQASLKSFSWLK